jgi:hypothetical protein
MDMEVQSRSQVSRSQSPDCLYRHPAAILALWRKNMLTYPCYDSENCLPLFNSISFHYIYFVSCNQVYTNVLKYLGFKNMPSPASDRLAIGGYSQKKVP